MTSAERQAFGRRLRAEREKRRITLDAISEATKIKASTFARLEAGDATAMPAGVLRRGYVRQYAAAIGLPPESIASEFVQLFEDEDADAAPDAPRSATQLRLTMAVDGRSEAAAGALALGAAVAEAAALVLLAALMSYAGLGSFWPVLAISGVSYYAMSNARLGRTPARWFLEAHSLVAPQRVRRPEPLDAAPERAA